ncbi:MAG: 6-phosphogluconolactonase [Verrucomicrobia bacterium]|nr:MAG: 6-phosphogluconolactonase [Verrucomicrobiota bacterium]
MRAWHRSLSLSRRDIPRIAQHFSVGLGAWLGEVPKGLLNKCKRADKAPFKRRYATQKPTHGYRGLKPTATVISSLRDEAANLRRTLPVLQLLRSTILAIVLMYCLFMSARAIASEDQILVYIGTYTGERSQGIYVSRFEPATGKLTPPELAAKTTNPSFLAVRPKGDFLYAVGELIEDDKPKAGAVVAYRIDRKTGKLTLLNRRSSGGKGPCHVAVDQTGQCLLVANYGSGTLAALPIQPDGKLGIPSALIQDQGSSVNPERQEGPHAHFTTVSPDNRFALCCDLGLDKVLVYHLDPAKAMLSPNDPPSVSITPGSGPRHIAFHPDGRFVCLINELSSTLTLLSYDPQKGVLKELQTLSTLPNDPKVPKSASEIHFHPNGRFVYASNRGHDSIAIFGFDAEKGKLTFIEHQESRGKIPRYFGIDPTGQWMLIENQDSNDIVVFRIDPKTGRLKCTEQQISVGQPVCAVFVR